MLHGVGYRRIRYVHGSDEHGRDIIFFDVDRLGQETLHAAQVKFGNIRGTQKSLIQTQITPQLLEGLRAPYRDPETGRTHHVSRMYLIVSGEILGTAKDQFHDLLSSQPNIVLIDRQAIDLLADRDGIDTIFAITPDRKRWISTGSEYGLPRLPMLSVGTDLEIGVHVEELDFYAEAFEITHVSYNPIHRVQEVRLHVPGITDKQIDVVHEAIYRSLRESSAVLWEVWLDYAFSRESDSKTANKPLRRTRR